MSWVEGPLVRWLLRDDRAAERLAAYLRHVQASSSTKRGSPDEIVIVLPESADVVERRSEGHATEIRLRIETAT